MKFYILKQHFKVCSWEKFLSNYQQLWYLESQISLLKATLDLLVELLNNFVQQLKENKGQRL